MPAGCIAIADALGRTDAGIFGDILCTRMRARGVKGLVSDGVVRDRIGVSRRGPAQDRRAGQGCHADRCRRVFAVEAARGAVGCADCGESVATTRAVSSAKRALAAATLKRIAPLPEVATFDESGFPGLEVDNWFGIIAPAKTPKDTLTQLAGWFTAALGLPEVKARLAETRLLPMPPLP